MRHSSWWPQLLLIVAAAAIYFVHLGGPSLWDIDEPRNAECAREMLEAGDWIVPTFNHELRAHKPVLLYWFMMTSYSVFGVTEFAARFWSAMLSIGTVLITYHLGRRLFDAQVAFWSGLILATSLNFIVVSRAATPDAVFLFFSTSALALFAASAIGPRQTAEGSPTVKIPSRRRLAWIYAAIGMAVLTKGPVGVVLNGAVLGLWVLLGQTLVPGDHDDGNSQGWWQKLKSTFALRRIYAAARTLHPITAIAVVSLVALPWYVAVSYRTDGAFLSEFLLRHNLGRFVAPMENHEGPIFYYVVAVCIGFFPWSLFLGSTLKQLATRLRPRGQWDQAWLFVSCWIAVYFIFFSLATTKLPHYVLPIYPALALASGAFVRELLTRASAAQAQSLRMASIGLLVVGGILVVTLLVLVKLYLPGEAAIAVLGLVPIVGGAVCLWLARRSLVRYSMGAFAATAVTFALVAFGFVQLRADRHQNTNVLVDAIRASTDEPVEIAGYLHFRPSWVFYAEQYIPAFDKTKQVQAFFENSQNPYLITTELGLARLEARHRLPADVVKVVELPNFLRKGNVILLARQNAKIKLAENQDATRR